MSNFWKNKRVFLTGHTGFKGCWMSLWLTQLGAEVHGYSLSPTCEPNLFIGGVEKCIENSIIADIRDREALNLALQQADPHIVIHMAAQPLVLTGYQLPVETFETNALGTLYLLEAIRNLGSIRVLLNVTTDKCYDTTHAEFYSTGFTETAPLGGSDPYSASKACSEWITQSYQSSYLSQNNIRCATARAGNIIGGGDWSPHRLVPDLVDAIIHKKVVQLRYPMAVRPWQHVLDALQGYLMLIEALWHDRVPSSQWNFGPSLEKDTCVTVMDLVNDFKAQWNNDVAIETVPFSTIASETKLLRLNANKAMNTLGWSTRLNMSQTVAWTIKWYQAFYQGKNAAELIQQQIEQYCTLKN